jgi:hypothetical protein
MLGFTVILVTAFWHTSAELAKMLLLFEDLVAVDLQGWRDGSAVKSTGCSSTDPEFNSQHPHGSLQLSETPTLPHRQTCRQNSNAHKNISQDLSSLKLLTEPLISATLIYP